MFSASNVKLVDIFFMYVCTVCMYTIYFTKILDYKFQIKISYTQLSLLLHLPLLPLQAEGKIPGVGIYTQFTKGFSPQLEQKRYATQIK